MLLQMRPCPRCGLHTYHRYHNSLRGGFVSRSHWICLDCGRREDVPPPNPTDLDAPSRARLAEGRAEA